MELSRRAFLGTTAGAAAHAAFAPAGRADAAVAAQDQLDPLGVRKDFPALQDYTFLNTAYMGFIPQAVVDAGHDWLEARARRTSSFQHMLAKTDEARRLYSGMVGAGEDDIGFLSSTTEGENVVVNSLEFKAGDNIVFDDFRYKSDHYIFNMQCIDYQNSCLANFQNKK